MKHHNNFDLLRLFAACQVVFMHSIALLQMPRDNLLFDVLSQFPGVPVFFVISGFLVTDSYLRSTAGEFYIKRALRIYPALFVNIAVLEAAVALTGTLAQLKEIPALYPAYFLVYALTASDWIASSLTTVPWGLWVSGFFKNYPNGALWTLTVELSFYLILPLLLLPGRIGLSLLALSTAGSLILVSYGSEAFLRANVLLSLSVLPTLWIFAIGILCRLSWPRIAPAFQGKGLYWLLGYALLAVASIYALASPAWIVYLHLDVMMFVRTTAMGLTVIACAFTMPALSRFLRGRDFSYGLYLYHMLVISILVGFGLHGDTWLWAAVYLGTFALAAASWFLIEKPALDLKRLLTPRGKGRSGATWRPPASAPIP